MSLNTNKNSYGATDLEAGTTGSHIKDAAGVGRQATVNGEIIKSYCPWVWQNANRKKHCKQMKNNVLVSTACPCACAGY